MEPALHSENRKVTDKPQQSVLLNDIGRINDDFRRYNGAKNRIMLYDKGVFDPGYSDAQKKADKKTMKLCATLINDQLKKNGWEEYFNAGTYLNAWNKIDRESMPQEVRVSLKKLCKDYCYDFQYFKTELQKEEFTLQEEESSSIPTFQ
ncbi:TPA: hypothetical protein ACTXXA_001536 [Legionella anisa]